MVISHPHSQNMEKKKEDKGAHYREQIKISLGILLIWFLWANLLGMLKMFYYPVVILNLALIVYHLIRLSRI